MARAEAHLVGYMLAIYIDAAHSYGVAGEGQCSGKALGRPYSMEQTFHQIWYGHAHGAFACLTSSLVIPSSAIVKFIYSEKATKFCKIFTLLLTGTT